MRGHLKRGSTHLIDLVDAFLRHNNIRQGLKVPQPVRDSYRKFRPDVVCTLAKIM